MCEGEITERKKVEETLWESEQRFRSIYSQTNEFIRRVTPNSTLINANHIALDFCGLQRSDVLGKPFLETFWWDLSRELQERLKASIAEAAIREFAQLRAQHRAQDGAIEEIDLSVRPMIDRAGKVIQIVPKGRRISPLTRVQD